MDSLPYYEIPEYPENYNSGNTVSRMIDGLGYRYYWATKDLRTEDLAYKPDSSNRTVGETIEHILSLSRTVLNTVRNKPNIRPGKATPQGFEEQRAETLNNMYRSSEILLGRSAEDLASMEIIFKRGENERRFPFWHVLNGPLADAIYHTGQIVAFRRAAGNPVDPRMNVFAGKSN